MIFFPFAWANCFVINTAIDTPKILIKFFANSITFLSVCVNGKIPKIQLRG